MLSLFQVIFKVLRDTLVQMHALVTHHVVPLAGIGEKIGLGACLDALLDEHEAVLRHYSGVVVSGDDLQSALQVLGLRQQ